MRRPRTEEMTVGDTCEQCKRGTFEWDPDYVGTTVGGLTVRGALVCSECGVGMLSKKHGTKPHEAWKLARGGRSVETGNGRIRIDGGDAEELCARIVKLPELEAEVAKIREPKSPEVEPKPEWTAPDGFGREWLGDFALVMRCRQHPDWFRFEVHDSEQGRLFEGMAPSRESAQACAVAVLRGLGFELGAA